MTMTEPTEQQSLYPCPKCKTESNVTYGESHLGDFEVSWVYQWLECPACKSEWIHNVRFSLNPTYVPETTITVVDRSKAVKQ